MPSASLFICTTSIYPSAGRTQVSPSRFSPNANTKSWCKNNSVGSGDSISCRSTKRSPKKRSFKSVQISEAKYLPFSSSHGMLSYPIPIESHPILATRSFPATGTANVPHPKNSALYPSYPICPLCSNS